LYVLKFIKLVGDIFSVITHFDKEEAAVQGFDISLINSFFFASLSFLMDDLFEVQDEPELN